MTNDEINENAVYAGFLFARRWRENPTAPATTKSGGFVASVGRTGPQITQVPRPAEYDDEELAGKIFPGHAQSVICGIGVVAPERPDTVRVLRELR
jgi:hypothetical protein